tara:strand:+ start:86 stop:382 length:297 start_codon:yes stop_codon:yes gene_type:complete
MNEGQRDLLRRFANEMMEDGVWIPADEVVDWVIARFHGKGGGVRHSLAALTVNREYRKKRPKKIEEMVDIFYERGTRGNREVRLYREGDGPYYRLGSE